MNNILKIGQCVTLNDNKDYIVVSSIDYDDNNFIYLINTVDQNIQYIGVASQNDEKIDIKFIDTKNIENKDLISNLIKLFFNDVEKYLKKENLI